MKKFVGSTVAMGLVAAMAVPTLAFAAPGDNLTPVTPGADGDAVGVTTVTWETDSTQLDITVPTTIVAMADANGALTMADAGTLKITNNSIFAVHGSKYVTAETEVGTGMERLELVQDVATAKAADATKNLMDFQIKASGNAMDMGPQGNHAVTAGDLNIAKGTSEAGMDMPLNCTGNVWIGGDLSKVSTDAFTIEWHFEAGTAA